jgi:predicted unusual protein kinase regulating ubiquinone biosynthesis (AarF/ABC1/UbiB family)
MWSPRVVRPLEIGVGLKLVPAADRGKWLRRALDGAGPTYVKAGQFISNRPDIFGKEFSRELAPLRDNVTPFDFEQVRNQVPKEVSDVNPVPFASASIAQVHRAKLKNKDVVLKIKRPGIEAQIKEDLDLIRGGTSLLNMIPNFGMDAVMPWLDEFERGLVAELDFRKEVKNISYFRDMYRDRKDIIIPRPYSRLSSNNVIIMDWTPSKPITAPFKAERLINMFLEQLLYEGVIHGDLHTGNLGISSEGGKTFPPLVLYDFGNIIRVTDKYKTAIRDFVYGVQTKNLDTVMDNMTKMGMVVRDREVTRIFVKQYFDYLDTLDLSSFTINSPEIRAKASKVPVELDPTTLVILRTYSLLEGLAKELDPQFSYEKIITKNIETLFLDIEYIMYRIEKDSSLGSTGPRN